MRTSERIYVRENANEPRATFKVREVNLHLTAMERNTGGTSPLHRHNNVADSKKSAGNMEKSELSYTSSGVIK